MATARGDRAPEMYWELKNKKLASGDDISAIVVGLQVCTLLMSFSQAPYINSFIRLFGSKFKPLAMDTLSSFPARQAGAFGRAKQMIIHSEIPTFPTVPFG